MHENPSCPMVPGDTIEWRAGDIYRARVRAIEGPELVLENVQRRKKRSATSATCVPHLDGTRLRWLTGVEIVAKPRPNIVLGKAHVALLRALNKAANYGGNVCDGIWYDPGAAAPRKTLEELVKKGLAEARDVEGRRAWKLSGAGVDECIARGLP